MILDYVEGHLILSSLWDFDRYFLPRFVTREFLYKLIKDLMAKMQIEYQEDKIPRPNLFEEKIDRSKSFEIDLSDNDLDIINRAVNAEDFKGGDPAYPKYIQDAAERVILKIEQALEEKSYEVTPENQRIFEMVFFGGH